jgi:hypothetical protein
MLINASRVLEAAGIRGPLLCGRQFQSLRVRNVMSRDTVGRCLETSLHFWGFGIPAGDGGAVLAGVQPGALRVACGQS